MPERTGGISLIVGWGKHRGKTRRGILKATSRTIASLRSGDPTWPRPNRRRDGRARSRSSFFPLRDVAPGPPRGRRPETTSRSRALQAGLERKDGGLEGGDALA